MTTILQINTVANVGSTGRITKELEQFIIASGWDSYIAYGRNKPDCKPNLLKIGSRWDIFSHGLQTRLFDRHGLGSVYATRKMIAIINKIKPDIIHLHNIHGYYLNYQILFNYLSVCNIPVVWTMHDCWAYTGHCVYYTEVKCDKWKTHCDKCSQLKTYPATFLFDRSSNNYIDKKIAFLSLKKLVLVPVSNWLANEIKQSFLGTFPMSTIYNGVDLDLFKPCESIKAEYNIQGKFLILCVANIWSERKGLKDILSLAKKISSDKIIVMVGLTNRKKIPKNIIAIEQTDSIRKLAQLYSSADIFINTSVEETFGLTTAESLACGTPVLVYNSTACPEIVSEKTGFVVEPHDVSGILKSIELVVKNTKKYYSAACRSRAEQLFDKKQQYGEYIQLYKSLLQNK